MRCTQMAKIMSNFRKDVACRFSSLLEHLRVSGFHILISSYNNEDHDCPCMKSFIRCLLQYLWVSSSEVITKTTGVT